MPFVCARYTLASPHEDVLARFEVDEEAAGEPELTRPRYNAAPTQTLPVLISRRGQRALGPMRWGLVPRWAKDARGATRAINARMETLAEKPSFRDALRLRRCVVPADGFYEWRAGARGQRLPLRFQVEGGALFGFAGLWDVWRTPSGDKLATFTIVTVPPNQLVAPIHDRMPAILERAAEAAWLDPEQTDAQAALALLHPFAADHMSATPVSTHVNDVRHDDPACLAPA